MSLIIKSAWILIKDHQILSTRSKGKKVFYIPGGKPEQGESDEEALIREIKEELTVNLVTESIQFIETFEAQAHGHSKDTIVRMNCFYAQYEGTLSPNSEIAEIAWLNYQDTQKISYVDKIIFEWLHQQNLLK